MDKKTVAPVLFGAGFIVAALAFWYAVAQTYLQPFAWLRFDETWNMQLIPIAISIITMILFASLLTIFRPNRWVSGGVYLVSGLAALLFQPSTLLTALVIIIFVIGFVGYENTTSHVFHSYIKISFWATYSHTIPGLLTTMAFVFAFGHLQAAMPAAQTFEYTISDELFGQVTSLISAQTDPDEAAGADGVDSSSTGDGSIEQNAAELFGIDPTAISGTLGQYEQQYQTVVLDQARQAIEQQINNWIDQYRIVIPILSAVVVFLFFSIINLPVMLLSIGLMVATMKFMQATGVISIVPVKMDVERIAW
jgi:hypothetical protein